MRIVTGADTGYGPASVARVPTEIARLIDAGLPPLTALQAATILRGAVVTETVFAWPGIGKIAIDAVYGRDFPLVQAAVLLMGVIFLIVNFLVDMLYVLLDPRISYVKR